jgi:serine/threonine protein kinase
MVKNVHTELAREGRDQLLSHNPAAESDVDASLTIVPSSARADTHGAGLQAWLAGEGITLGKALAVNPETGCRSHLGTVETAGGLRPCIVKTYDPAWLGEMLANRETAEKAWRTESEVLKACSAGHEDLAEPWRLPRLIRSLSEHGLCCNVIEYVEGEGLDERLKRGKLSEEEAWKLLLEGMRCLEALHGHGFAHRDVRPANLVVRPDGGVTLIDVNTAHEAGRTSFTVLKEQDWHMIPPDAAWRDTPLDADVYALGAIVMGGLLGRAPCELLRPDAPYGYLDLGLLEGADGISKRMKAAVSRVCATEPAMRPAASEREIAKLEKPLGEEQRELSPRLHSSLGEALAQIAAGSVKRRRLGYSQWLRHTSPNLPVCMGGGTIPSGVCLDSELLNRARELDHNALRAELMSKLERFGRNLAADGGRVSVRLRWLKRHEGAYAGATWVAKEQLRLCLAPKEGQSSNRFVTKLSQWFGAGKEMVIAELTREVGWVQIGLWWRWKMADPANRGNLIWYNGEQSALKYSLRANSQRVIDCLSSTPEGEALQSHLRTVELAGVFESEANWAPRSKKECKP